MLILGASLAKLRKLRFCFPAPSGQQILIIHEKFHEERIADASATKVEKNVSLSS
jgi:hypothetical protein